MATQRLTIAKIAGAASGATLDLFRHWRAARLVEDSDSEWSPEQWPEDVRRQADEWALNLRQNGHKPPIVFFAEYVDSWSFCPPMVNIGEDSLIEMFADRYELFCLQLPIDAELGGHLKQLRRKGQWPEDRLFGKLSIDAITAWRKVIDKGVVVFLREVLGASILDEEVEQSLIEVPEWFLPGGTG
jgi:hypothetical protein